MRRSIATGLALATIALSAATVGAQTEQLLVCTFESRVALDPGETLSPSQGAYEGEGTASCRGMLDGEQIDGTGTISFEGTGGSSGPIAERFGGDSCLFGSGTGTVELLIDAGDSTIELVRDYELVRLGVVGYATAEQMAATFQFIPDTGPDCVYNPIVNATVYGEAIFSELLPT